MVRTAQKKARVGDKPVGCGVLRGYQINGTTVANAVINLQAVCNSQIASDTYTLPNGVTLKQNLSITFNVLAGGTSQPGIVVVQNAAGTTYTFTVGSGGDISEGVFVPK